MRILLTLACAALLFACETVPITGRKQIRLLSNADESKLGLEAYRETLSKAEVLTSGPEVDLVRRVGERIAKVSDDPGFEWEFNVVRDDQTVNAFCLPGGKVAVYTGILPVTATEDGLAVVLGHEIAHAIAHHGAERVSQAQIVEGLGTVVETGLAKSSSGTKTAVMAAFGLGSQVGVLLPYGRKQESEADHIGVIYMARAGYDPRASVDFWKRMGAKGGSKPPEFLSTHPSDETRIEDLGKLLPEAIREYEKARRTPAR